MPIKTRLFIFQGSIYSRRFWLRGSFLIKAKDENTITDKGVRAFVMEKILNYPFTRGTVINLDKKTVQVQLEGDEKTIHAFIKDLEKSLAEQFGNPAVYLTLFQEDKSLEIPPLMRSSQALMVGQLQKGINIQLEILKTLKGSEDSTQSMKGAMGSMKESMDSMSGSVGSMKESLESLPQRIAKALKENSQA